MVCAHDQEMQVRVRTHRLGDRTTVIPVGEIDVATSPVLRDCLAACSGHVVVDLSAVTFLDSSGIGALALHRNRISEDGGALELRDPQPIVRAAIEAVGLGHWITS